MSPRQRSSRDREPRSMGRRIVLSIKGVGGHGKTDFYTTAPKPILALSLDPNTRDVLEKIFKVPADEIDPEVLRLVDIPYPLVGFERNEDDVMTEAREGWARVIDEVRDVMEEKCDVMPKTVAIDTGTELDTLNILSEFGRTDKISPAVRRIKMGNVNNQFKGIFRALERAGVHVIVTHRVRERWETTEVRGRNGLEEKDQRVPGKFDRIGFKQMENLCNTEIIVKFDPEREGKLSNRFGMEVERCMIRPALVGQEFWGKDEESGVRCASFPYLATKLYPMTTLEDWE